METDQFWIVLNATGPECWRGLVKYKTEGLAEIAAADRVAKYPHIEYFICRAVSIIRTPRPKVEVIKLEE